MMEASVIIPTFNRKESLRQCLEALRRQTAPSGDFEVLVVVDGSTDGSLEMVQGFQAPFALRVIQQPNRGQPAALNNGAAAARGRTLIFIDDDILASPALVSEHIRLHRQEKAVGIGKIELSLAENADWYARVFSTEWRRHYDLLDHGLKQPSWQDCFGGNMSVSRAMYEAVGGNAEDLQRAFDLDLAYRLACAGCAFTYLSQAAGEQRQLKGFHELAEDSAKSGAACVELSRRHPALLAPLLGSFGEQRLKIALELKILLALNVSPALLERICQAAGRRAQTEEHYHLIQRYRFWREVRHRQPNRRGWRALIQGVPILMYHAFGDNGEPASRYILPIRRFAQQMAWLKWNGYQVLNLEQYLEDRIRRRPLPARCIVITIDDGYTDTLRLACPILRRFHFPATVFLIGQSIGKQNTWDPNSPLSGRVLLSWADIEALRQEGLDFGAHTLTHPDLTRIPVQQAQVEIEQSRADLEQKLCAPVRSFCYPYGKYNPQIQAIAEQAGYLGSASTDIGTNTLVTPLHRLRRIEVYGDGSLLDFALSLWTGLDPQNLRKQIRKP